MDVALKIISAIAENDGIHLVVRNLIYYCESRKKSARSFHKAYWERQKTALAMCYKHLK